ncbi:MAG: hypothetical protein IJ943_00825 [Akkermansia sp.]|nr:hypothetical protein [Akkermansia sp.]
MPLFLMTWCSACGNDDFPVLVEVAQPPEQKNLTVCKRGQVLLHHIGAADVFTALAGELI